MTVLFKMTVALTSLFFATLCHANTQHPEPVKKLFAQTRPDAMWQNLKTLTQFPDRAATTSNGIAAADWIKNHIEHLMRQSKRHDVHLYTIPTREFPQPSIMLKIGNNNSDGIVVGAHFDTVDCEQHACAGTDVRPGADDNGSGTVTLLEIARILLNNNMRFSHPIYLAWYAAEENDLNGSQSVVNYFHRNHMPVKAVMQLDMTAATSGNNNIWLSDTNHYQHVSKSLTQFTYQLARKYLGNNVAITHLDDESDHWSWHDAGYKAVYPVESNCHGDKKHCPYREHTAHDTMQHLSLAHMTNYLKLALAFITELAVPT